MAQRIGKTGDRTKRVTQLPTMKNAHFLHVFLAAVICYSQIVATAHDVTHISTYGHQNSHNLSYNACVDFANDADHVHSPGHKHDFTHSNQAASEDESEPNCAIYHAVLNLNGVPSTPQSLRAVPDAKLHYPLALYNFPALTSFDHQSIRAPPTNS